jgi:phage host-nuclease inhibitor protein Gam
MRAPISLLLFALTACQITEDPALPTLADASTDAARTETDAPSEEAEVETAAPTNCVPPGTPNNDKGVGGYCEKNSDCVADGSATVCSARFGAGAGSWFCTGPCVRDEDCGEGVRCVTYEQGSGCVPLACGGRGDAGATDGDDADGA